MLRRLFPGAIEPSQDAYDTGPLRRHPATRRTRWLWVVPLVAWCVFLFGWVVAHDPGPGLSLSDRGWLTVGLAGLLALLLAEHRRASAGRLARMLAEYTAVALLALLLTSSAHPQAKGAIPPGAKPPQAAQAIDLTAGCPEIARVRAWLECVRQHANAIADRAPTTTTGRDSR
jgi:hypothetical protein